MVEYQFKVPVAGEYAPPSTETPTLDTAKLSVAVPITRIMSATASLFAGQVIATDDVWLHDGAACNNINRIGDQNFSFIFT